MTPLEKAQQSVSLELTKDQLDRRYHWQRGKLLTIHTDLSTMMRRRRELGGEFPAPDSVTQELTADMDRWLGELLDEWGYERRGD
ncbi:MAG: hypothetical protein ACR2PW_04620 [Gammaproteobacteria bacterium]